MQGTVTARQVEEEKLKKAVNERADEVCRLAGITETEKLAEATSRSVAMTVTPPGHLDAIDLTSIHSPVAAPLAAVLQPGAQGF